MIRILIAGIALAAIVSALSTGADQSERAGRDAAGETRSDAAIPVKTPPPPGLDRGEVDQQDGVGAAHRRREGRIFDSRRLLTALPIERAGVRIDIAGLDDDGQTSVLSVVAGRRSRAFARRVYLRALAAHGDPGTNYRLRWQR